jgi:anaphase-promoting complex subunit 3
MENQLLESVKHSLRNELYSNAAFLCERLFAEVRNEDVRLLLAECYLGEGKTYKAYEVLRDCSQAANRYKFALTCLKLNKFQEAEKALINKRQARPLMQNETIDQLRSQVPNGAAGLYLLGLV